MSTDVARSSAASSRGRGTGRGGRGGFGGRSANPRRPNGEKSADGFDDDDDVGQLRKQYGSKLDTIKELFPDWSDADILYALQETDGDIELAATRISEGSVSQWGEVSKPKKSSAKAKDSGVHATASDISGSRPARGGRVDSGRGGRGRGAGAERARGAGRGRAGSQAVTSNGHQSKEQLSTPTDEAWETAATSTSQSTGADSWANAAAGATPAPKAATTASPATKHAKAVPTNTAPEAAAPKPAAPAVKTWASMLRQPIVPKPAPKPKETPEATQAPEPAATLPTTEEPTPEPAAEPTPEPAPVEEQPEVADEPKIIEPEVALPPPEDNLTKVNLELLPDESKPLATATVASTTADSWDPRQQAPLSAVATPLSASQAQHQAARPAASGFAASALKATDRPAQRMPSYQRRLLEQEEAVRMPGNREVDRTAVQFGAFNLGDSEEDIDGDREEPETRTQPPPESPSAPRAALPPVSQATPGADAFSSAQKGSSISAATPIAAPTGPVGSAAQTPQAPGASQQFRQQFQQTNAQEPAGFQQKPYDSFAQQNPATTSAGFDSFSATTSQAPGPQGGFSSASPGDYSSYYNAEQSGRNAYNNYYAQQYAQQGGSQHEGHGSSRGFGAYGAGQTDNISQYPQSGAQQSRFGAAAAATDSQNSGHNTPNPTTQSQHQAGGQNSQPQSGAHQQPHGNHYGQHPYYTSPYYAQYMNQAYGGYGQGYGGGPYGKSGGYGQPHQYGMNPQGPYDHSSSPAATSGFGGQSSVSGRDSGLGSSVDNYGRAGSSQAGGQGGFGGSSFGGSHDTFGRGSGYPQSGQGFNAPNAQAAGGASGADDLKPYGVDSKTGAGPSPSLSGAARPGSATNTPGAPGLPPVQSGQQGAGGYGGYPGHGQQSHGLHGGQSGNSAYGLGGSGAQGQAGNNPYGGGYGGSQGFGNYYGNRQQQQHQGGWGGNYH